MDEVTVVTPTGCIGNRGIDRDAFISSLEEADAVASDAGSFDPGPWYLGAGQTHSPFASIYADLDLLLTECTERGIPVLIGSAGGSGGNPHLDFTLKLVKEIATKRKLEFKLATIESDVKKEYVVNKIKKGVKIRKAPVSLLGDELTIEEVNQCTRITAMMGVEPFVEALKEGGEVIIAGRASDSCVISAYPVFKGFDRALSLHMGDIMECGDTALVDLQGVTTKRGANRIPVIGTLRRDHFLLKSSHPGMGCTITSAAAHSLYERESALFAEFPGGILDKTASKFEQYDERTTKISGTKFKESPEYTVLLEGVGRVGYRAITIFGIRNPVMISQIDDILSEANKREAEKYHEIGKFNIYYHVYGKNGVLGAFEPEKSITSHELGIVADIVAGSQSLAHEIAEDLWLRLGFWRYKGRTTTAGNIAVLFSPNVIDAGEVYNTFIKHQMPLKNPLEPFRTKFFHVRKKRMTRA